MPKLNEFHEAFRYEDGKLFWRYSPRGGVSAGTEAGGPAVRGYWKIKYKYKLYLRHRIVYFLHTGEWPLVIDHINRTPGDDRFENLRGVSQMMNIHNSDCAWGDVPFRGVHFKVGSNKFTASFSYNKTRKQLGYFETAEEASHAYEAYRKKVLDYDG